MGIKRPLVQNGGQIEQLQSTDTIQFGTVEIDFGATPSVEASVSVTGLTDITSSSRAFAFIASDSTTDNSITDHEFASIALKFICGIPTDGIGFTIKSYCTIGEVTGKFKINYKYS
jgi:hypothetical protein